MDSGPTGQPGWLSGYNIDKILVYTACTAERLLEKMLKSTNDMAIWQSDLSLVLESNML